MKTHGLSFNCMKEAETNKELYTRMKNAHECVKY